MEDNSFQGVESQLISIDPTGAPVRLRAVVLADIERELRASQWDRRFARAAALLLAIGVGLNLALMLRTAGPNAGVQLPVAQSSTRQSLVDTAVVVAEATDAATGSRFARQLAALSGRELTADEVAAIDVAMQRFSTNGNRG